MSLPLEINNIYNFTTKVPGILNLVYKNAKLTSILNYDAASKIKVMAGAWASAYPYLSADGANTIVNNPAAYKYYVFTQFDNTTVIVAEPWFNANSIQLVKSISLGININGLTDLSDVTTIISLLKSSGYTDFSTNVINPS